MDRFDTNKKYESFKIPGRQQVQGGGDSKELPHSKIAKPVSLEEGMFYEIEYNSCPIPGVGKFVLKSQKIEEPKKDEKRELFDQMRDISRAHHSTVDISRFFDKRVQHNNATIFYKQGMFMKDFTDNYTGNKEFSQYFPSYHMMGYEQLRTYFTWRTEVRKGNVTNISLSYAFVYIYELLANIGVSDSQDGLNQLMSFWKAFRTNNQSMDKYVLRWLKDYHIYYELPHSFKEFVDTNDLSAYYPKMVDINDNFDFYCSISKYDIRKSAFFTDDKVKLITDCFFFVINELKQILLDDGINFNESIFQPTKKISEWKPFGTALFYQWLKQADRQILLSENEIYMCYHNKWTFSTVITSENGRQLIGYIMKQMEAVLRELTNYKFKLSANLNGVTHEVVGRLKEANLSLEKIIRDTVTQFYKEETKTVIIVDHTELSRIREESLLTQESLFVPEQENQSVKLSYPAMQDMPVVQDIPTVQGIPTVQDTPSIQSLAILSSPVMDPWEDLKNILTDIEINALSVVLDGEIELKKYADEWGIMLEVLVDGINEKAMDFIGDNLLDEEFILYNDYKEQVKELIR